MGLMDCEVRDSLSSHSLAHLEAQIDTVETRSHAAGELWIVIRVVKEGFQLDRYP